LSVLTYTYLYSSVHSSSLLPFLPNTLLFQYPSSSILIHSILVGTWIRLFIFIYLSYSSLPIIPSQYSFYTCRYLHILIYILPMF
jgi:hypothetical protein